MTKYVANAMLATKISFINEMANLCEKLGADINDVRRGIGHDQRIGFQFLFPGPGYGGCCFPKDVNALIHLAKSLDVPVELMEAVDRVNRSRKPSCRRRSRRTSARPQGKMPGRLGPGVQAAHRRHPRSPRPDADRRAARRRRAAARPRPRSDRQRRQIYGDKLIYCDRPYGALEGADGLAIVTEWQEFRHPDFEVMQR